MPLNKLFSVISDPALLLKKNLRAFAIDLRNTGKLAGVLGPRNGKKQTSNEQRNKLFDSRELGPAESKSPAQLQGTT